MPEFTSRLRAVGRVAILVSRYNELITRRLLDGALACCDEAGVARGDVDVVWVPGAFELPVAGEAEVSTRRPACLFAFGAVGRAVPGLDVGEKDLAVVAGRVLECLPLRTDVKGVGVL